MESFRIGSGEVEGLERVRAGAALGREFQALGVDNRFEVKERTLK
jgi:hypothetical protein